MELVTLLVLACTLSAAKCALYIDDDCYIFPVYPVQYEITLTPYMSGEQFYYEGEITITAISFVNGQLTIELDSRGLQIHDGSVSVFVDNRDIVDQRRPFLLDKQRGKVVIYLREGLRKYDGYKGKNTNGGKNQYYIKMRFRGNINKGDSGLFATSYREGNSLKWLLSTRLAPNYASTVFPCFDNPRAEAGFILRVYRPAQLHTTLSVSREARQQEISSHTLVEFAPSPQIPSYKLGLHVSEFVPHQLPAPQGQAAPVVVWTRREQTDNHYFTLSFANKVLSAFNSYMNWTRPVTSGPINVVAIPNYWRGYEKGAWNLLTVGEHKFLIVDEQVSALQKEQIEFELARQLSRVWLGNPDEASKTRWKQEWFKEGMATYFGHFFLVWGDMYQRGPDVFGLQTMFSAMSADSKSTQSISSFNITSADELNKQEDALVTKKTASILRMIEYWLGSDAFHKIVRDFLAIKHGRTISIQEFGDYLQQMAVNCEFFKGFTVSNIIGSWFNQPGHPVISVKVYRDRHVVSLSQNLFYLDPHQPISSHFVVPISYTTQVTDNCINCLQPRFIISGSDYTFQENLNGGWIILNRKASGYYRVNYDDENWDLIVKTLNSADRKRIDAANRAQIVNDAFALHAAGIINRALAARILGSLQREDELAVWDAAFQGFELMKQSQRMSKQSYDFWKKFMAEQVSKVYQRVNTGGQHDYQARVFKSKVVNFACSVELPACISDVGNLRLGRNQQVYDADLREAYYSVKLRRPDAWREAEQRSRTCDAYEREDILTAKKMADAERIYTHNLRIGPEEINMLPSSPSTGCCTGNPTMTAAAAKSLSAYFLGLVMAVTTLCLLR